LSLCVFGLSEDAAVFAPGALAGVHVRRGSRHVLLFGGRVLAEFRRVIYECFSFHICLLLLGPLIGFDG
jgi:hypothetical protein